MSGSIRGKSRLALRKLAGGGGLRRWFVNRAWNTYEHIVFEYHTRRNVRAAETVAPLYPRRLYWIDPDSVTRSIARKHFDLLRDTGRVVGGDWDQNAKRTVEDLELYQTFVEHFENGVPWSETERYQRSVEQIRDGDHIRYPTEKALNRKYALYDRLYESFARGEYLTQAELSEERTKTVGDGGHAFCPRLTGSSIIRHEITVHVGRDGTLFLDDGRHRLLIARIAGVDAVPVRIVVRHELWQQIRDEVTRCVRNDQFETMLEDRRFSISGAAVDTVDVSHPDIESLTNDNR